MRLPLALLLLLLAAAPAAAAPVDFDLENQVEEIALDNGLRFLFVRRPGSGVFTGYLRVKVGGADERPGSTGVAHLFEHMAFKGTPVIGTRDWEKERPILEEVHALGEELSREQALREKADPGKLKELREKLEAASARQAELIVKDELTEILLRNGASGLNATTDKDLTSYFVSLPANRLELWALVEAQRFAAPVLREFYSEREVVQEERRMRVETNPGGLLYEALIATAFDASPYRWPTVGWMPELETLSIDDSMELRNRAYVPANAVGAIVGDLDPAEVRRVLERTFGAIPAGPEPAPIKAVEPKQRGEKRRVVRFDAKPQILVAFHKPSLPHRDDYVFDLIDLITSRGRTSRLYRRLVLEKKVASSVGAFFGPGSRLDNLFVVSATPAPGRTNAEVEKELLAVLAELGSGPIPAAELEKARNRVEADFVRNLSTNQGLAGALSWYELQTGDWRYIAGHREVIRGIGEAEIREVARRYFVPENRTVVTLERPE